MRNLYDQAKDQRIIKSLDTPDFTSENYTSEMMEYISLCKLDAHDSWIRWTSSNKTREKPQGPPKSQHSTSRFLVESFAGDDSKVLEYTLKLSETKKLSLVGVKSEKFSAFSSASNRFTLKSTICEDPHFVERLFSVIEGNVTNAIRSRISGDYKTQDPYWYPEDCYSNHQKRIHSSSFIVGSDRMRIALVAFFAIHYLRSQACQNMFLKEARNKTLHEFRIDINGETCIFSGKEYPQFIEFMLPAIMANMSKRVIWWVNHEDHLILSEKNAIGFTILPSQKRVIFGLEHGYHMVIAPKLSISMSSYEAGGKYHDLIVDGNEALYHQTMKKILKLVSLELLISLDSAKQRRSNARYIAHPTSDLNHLFPLVESSNDKILNWNLLDHSEATLKILLAQIPKQSCL